MEEELIGLGLVLIMAVIFTPIIITNLSSRLREHYNRSWGGELENK